MCEKGLVSDWCFNELPKHLLEQLILAKLGLKDFIRFAAVCRLWKSIAAQNQHYIHPLPWLLISLNKRSQTGIFLSLSESKFYNLKFNSLAPYTSFCSGSSQGYLIMANREKNFLFNPFSQNEICLPHQYVPRQDMACAIQSDDFRHYFMKAIISELTDINNEYVVAGLGNNHLVIEMCRPHDTEWSVFSADKDIDEKYTVIYNTDWPVDDDDDDDDDDNDEEEGDNVEVEKENKLEEEKEKEIVFIEENRSNKFVLKDIMFYNGMLYGLSKTNELVTFELQDTKPTFRLLNVLPMERPTDARASFSNNYLVESFGELLMVYRFRKFSDDTNTTIKFLVYKLDVSKDTPQWLELKSIGDQMIFLGRNSSMSISAKGVPGIKGNCIYFSEDYWPYFWIGSTGQPCLDNGIFYLEDGSIEPISTPANTPSFDMQPLWVMPNKLDIVHD